jgi:hypothetical protein
MSNPIETLKAILSEKLPDNQVQALMAELAIALGNGSVAIARDADATDAVTLTGSQNIAGDNNRVVINQGIDYKELLTILHTLFQEIKQSKPPTSQNTFHQFPEVSRFDLKQLYYYRSPKSKIATVKNQSR